MRLVERRGPLISPPSDCRPRASKPCRIHQPAPRESNIDAAGSTVDLGHLGHLLWFPALRIAQTDAYRTNLNILPKYLILGFFFPGRKIKTNANFSIILADFAKKN